MSQAIQKEQMQEFKGALNQSIASLAVAKAAYSSMMLTPEQVVPNRYSSEDKGYGDLIEASALLETANVQCTAAVFERAKADARADAAKPAIVQMNGGSLHN
jgi:hypothetical protein